MAEPSASTNIGALSISVTADYQAAMEGLTRVEQRMAQLAKKVEVRVGISDQALAQLKEISAVLDSLRKPVTIKPIVSAERIPNNLVGAQRGAQAVRANPSAVTSEDRMRVNALTPTIMAAIDRSSRSPRQNAMRSDIRTAMARTPEPRGNPLLTERAGGGSPGPIHVIVDNVPLPVQMGSGGTVPQGAFGNVISGGGPPRGGGGAPRPRGGRQVPENLPSVLGADEVKNLSPDQLNKLLKGDVSVLAGETPFERLMRGPEAQVVKNSGNELRSGPSANVPSRFRGPEAIDINRSDQRLGRQRVRELGRPEQESLEAAAKEQFAAFGLRFPNPENDVLARTRRLIAGPGDERLAAQVAAQQQRSLLPSRAFGTSVIQTVEGLFGGREGPLTRLAQLQQAGTHQNALINARGALGENISTEQDRLRGLLSGRREIRAQGGSPNVVDQLIHGQINTLRDQKKAYKELDEGIGKTTATIADLSKNAVTASDVMQNFAAGAVGGIAGIASTQFLVGIAQFAMQGAAQALGPSLDQLTGFAATTNKVTSDITAAIHANAGNAPAALAQTALGTGISANALNQISGPLQTRSTAQAASQNVTQVVDLLRSFGNLSGQQLDQALTGGTGGLLGGPISGTPGLFEAIGNEFAREASQAALAGQNTNVKPPGPHMAQFGPRAVHINPAVPAGEESAFADTLNAAFQRSDLGKGFQLVKGSAAQQKAFVASGTNISGPLGEEFSNIAKAGFVIEDASGKVVSGFTQVGQAADALAQGLARPDISTAVQGAQAFEIPEQVRVINRQSQVARQQTSAQIGLAGLAAPNPDINAFISTIGATSTTAIEKYRKEGTEAQNAINSAIEQGRQDLLNFIPPQFQTEATGLLDSITQTGKEIAGIQASMSQEQIGYDVAQFNNQLRIANRSLADARALAGQTSDSEAGQVGYLERQNELLSRQAQLLQFGLQQRQINFQVAVAGFQAPGLTSEERGARIEEAKLEASYAQKQLDIQKQLANNQFSVFNASAARNVTDLLAQVQLLTKGRQVTLDTAAAQQALDRLNKKQDIQVQKFSTYFQQGVSLVNAAEQEIAKLESDTQQALGNVANDVLRQYGIFINSVGQIENSQLGGGGSGGDRGYVAPGQVTPHGGGFNAAGTLFNTNGATSMVVGEAGQETVAVLRNPRRMAASGGGATLNVTINVTGVTNPDEVARRVIDSINRNAARIGIRSFASAVA